VQAPGPTGGARSRSLADYLEERFPLLADQVRDERAAIKGQILGPGLRTANWSGFVVPEEVSQPPRGEPPGARPVAHSCNGRTQIGLLNMVAGPPHWEFTSVG